MNNDSPINPYHNGSDDSVGSAPFAGRQDAFGRLYALITDPARTEAFLFLGRKGVGKTALLHAIAGIYRDVGVSVLVPLREAEIADESAWLLALAQSITAMLVEQGFTLTRLANIEEPGDDLRAWFSATFLPHVFAVLRTRQLFLLFDDAEYLIRALPADIFPYLADLLAKHRHVQMVFTLDTEHEDDVPRFGTLISYATIYRLGNLAPDAVKWLMNAPTNDYYRVPEEVTAAVYRQTGGEPTASQRFGRVFFQRWYDSPDLNVITPDDVKTAAAKIYGELRLNLRLVWDRLNANERLVLTAISGSLFDDPIGTITADSLQAWLVETDYPLDTTAINAALRGLEYRELLTNTANGIVLTSELMKTWLLENARTVSRAPLIPAGTPAAQVDLARGRFGLPRTVSPRVIRLLLIALALLIIANIIALALVNSNPPTILVTGTPPATVTLAAPTPTP
ncbi:MAG: ATP-binding protein [Anaerolinea sp.]|nr:ATP-binding protein [Anaerolinea sp.]